VLDGPDPDLDLDLDRDPDPDLLRGVDGDRLRGEGMGDLGRVRRRGVGRGRDRRGEDRGEGEGLPPRAVVVGGSPPEVVMIDAGGRGTDREPHHQSRQRCVSVHSFFSFSFALTTANESAQAIQLLALETTSPMYLILLVLSCSLALM
jgi:hypothetical protein